MSKKKLKHLVTVTDLSNEEVDLVYELAADTKSLLLRGIRSNALVGHVLGMIFEKPSMRTRISFQTAMRYDIRPVRSPSQNGDEVDRANRCGRM